MIHEELHTSGQPTKNRCHQLLYAERDIEEGIIAHLDVSIVRG